MNQSANK